MTRDMFNLQGHTVVVTGGMGQLGQQFAQTLIAHGANVALLDILPDAGRISSPLSEAEVGGRLMLVGADVTDRGSLEKALQDISTRWETPFGLVNNAALDSPPGSPAGENGPFETYPEESWDKVMDVNAKGVFLACQVFGAAMAAYGRGSIINVSSTYGMVSPDQSIYQYRRDRGEEFFKPVAYAASKSSLYNLTHYLAVYWGGKGVRVNTVSFGGVFNNQDDNFLSNYCARVPLGRMAREDEYNGAIVFLMSDASSYMTGSNMVIDGGWTAL
jgi:NAD(P)-dependent dehydrogenase (short-subunit alcohol dehydrogenase family)